MYKYTYLKPVNGSAILSDVEFGPDGILVVRNKIERLEIFIKEGWLKCEPFDGKVSVVSSPSVSGDVNPSTPKVDDQLPNPNDLDPVTRAVMGV